MYKLTTLKKVVSLCATDSFSLIVYREKNAQVFLFRLQWNFFVLMDNITKDCRKEIPIIYCFTFLKLCVLTSLFYI